MPPSRSNRRGRRVLLFPLVITLAVGLPIPLVWALGVLVGHTAVVAALSATLTAAFIAGFFLGRSAWGSPGPARLYLVQWPFFVWWTLALLFALLLPFVLIARAVFPIPEATALAAGVAAAAALTFGALSQRPRLRTRDVVIADLPSAFDGYRIAQISDLHVGPFAGARRVEAWVDAVNDRRPDLVAVTGDLIASGEAFIPVVAAALGRLSAPDGVFASLGNHDYFADAEMLVRALEAVGISVLRNRGVDVRRDGAAFHLAGVDDTWTRRNDVGRALADWTPGTRAVLLAHDPVLFPEAAARGVDLTLSGHTHGGQVAMPFAGRRLNMARLIARFTSGFYRLGSSVLYVNRGLGTTGPPIRIGVAPEIAVLVLRCGPSPVAASS